MWDSMSFLIGLFLGLLLMMIICWSTYATRTFIFTNCLNGELQCLAKNYYNDPGLAIQQEGAKPENILNVIGGKLYYRRVKKDNCRPGDNQDVYIQNPQFCEFKNTDGTTFKAMNSYLDSPYYSATVAGEVIDVTSQGDCNPLSSTSGAVISGKVLPIWVPY